ncbi:MAG: hypothetical protein U0169_18325 [Polyangiaceae bacterium]
MSLREAQRVVHAICLRAKDEREALRLLDEASDRADLDAGVRDVIRRDRGRFVLYRRLVRNNLEGVVNAMLSRTRARVNAVSDGAFDRAWEDFLAEVGPGSHYLRDVPKEFLAWARSRWSSYAGVPEWADDLAAYEIAEFVVSAMPSDPVPDGLVDMAPGRTLVFANTHALLVLGHAVHEGSASDAGSFAPARRPTHLFVYRDGTFAVRYLDLTPTAAAILRALLAGETVEVALRTAALATSTTFDDALLSGAAKLLADLAQRGVFLGAREA